MIETWKGVIGFEGKYKISNIGRVKSVKRLIIRSNGWPQTVKEKILTAFKNNEYTAVRLYKIGISHKTISIHRLVASAFVLNPLNKPNVNHIDGNKMNNCASNLEWCTASENTQHAIATGLMKCNGGDRPKLNMKTAQVIRTKYSKNANVSMLAREYDVSRSSIQKIINNKSYKL